MAAYFNLFAIVIVVINPRIMMCSYPKSIQKAAPMPQTRRERKLYHLWMYFGMLLPPAIYGSISAVSGGVSGFWPPVLDGLYRVAGSQFCRFLPAGHLSAAKAGAPYSGTRHRGASGLLFVLEPGEISHF